MKLQKGRVETMDAAYHSSTTGSNSDPKMEGSAINNATPSSSSSSSSVSVTPSTSASGENPAIAGQIATPSTSRLAQEGQPSATSTSTQEGVNTSHPLPVSSQLVTSVPSTSDLPSVGHSHANSASSSVTGTSGQPVIITSPYFPLLPQGLPVGALPTASWSPQVAQFQPGGVVPSVLPRLVPVTVLGHPVQPSTTDTGSSVAPTKTVRPPFSSSS